MILYRVNPKESICTQKSIRANKLSKVVEYKINMQNQLNFCTRVMNNSKRKLRK
jgi:hypothetical protein